MFVALAGGALDTANGGGCSQWTTAQDGHLVIFTLPPSISISRLSVPNWLHTICLL
jgi:hypothetical protein